jgi:hypothetical protein
MKIVSFTQSIFLTAIALFGVNLSAQTMETNVPGLVIKDFVCATYMGYRAEGNLVNRNADLFNGSLRVKIIDKDNDILWQGTQKLTVGGQNGARFSVLIHVGTCQAPNRVQITLER